jgi:hypothetical protein
VELPPLDELVCVCIHLTEGLSFFQSWKLATYRNANGQNS